MMVEKARREHEMSEQNYSIERDLKELETMVASLVPYVYEDELYGRVGMNMPSLTLGAVLLRLRRLRALTSRLTREQLATLHQLETQVHSVSQEWDNHYQKKLAREADARLRDIMTYTREWNDSPRSFANSYMPEALRRTMIQEILSALHNDAGLAARVKQVDSALRRYLQDSDFIWAEILKPVYPADTFWWLYKRPRQPAGNEGGR